MRLFNEIGPKFGDRQGGYTRIIKLPEHRIGDAADLVLLQLCTEESAPEGLRSSKCRPAPQAQRTPPPVRQQGAQGRRRGGGGAKTKP
jgi:large subunit ribosomal protein L17